MDRAAQRIGPGVQAREVYRAWQGSVDQAGLTHYRRHHCGYAVGIGFPPSWSGSGVPVGLRADSTMKLRPGMVFHLMSWLLRTGQGDSFLSDTVVVTDDGCEVITTSSRMLIVRCAPQDLHTADRPTACRLPTPHCNQSGCARCR